MANESTIPGVQFGQLPTGMFEEGGKFEPKQEFIDAARAKAIAEGKKYYGDATNFETFRDSVLNLPDAAINFLARGAEGTGELAAGIVSLVMKGGQLATATDPDKITQILSEPSFTKYMGAFRDKIPTPNLYESNISGMEDTEKAFGDVAYYTAPLSVVPAGVLAAGARSVAVPAGQGIARLADDIIKSFTRGDSGFRASAGGGRGLVDKKFLELFENNPNAVDSMGRFKASTGLNELLKLDETFVLGAKKPELIKVLEDKGIKFNVNQISRLRTLYKRFTGKKKVSELINFDDPQVSNIMERTIVGDLTKKDAAKLLDEIYPGSGFVDISMGGKADKTFTEFYESYTKNLDDDVFKLLSTSKKGTPKSFFDALNVGDKVTPKASGYLRFTTIFDDTGKNFSQTKASFLNNNIANDLINKTKNLFQDKSIQIFDVDHIQAPRFGGTNAESNLRLITKADHNSLKALPSYKTLATDVVKAKSGFENDYYKLSTRLIDNVKNNNFEAADKIAESLRVMVDNFKNTYKNVDFVVGTPHVAIKTGDKTAKYIKYGDDVKLTNKQKKYIEDNNLLPTQSNLPNAGKPIEKQAEDIYQGYLQIYNLIGEIPSGSIGKVAENIKSMDVPLPRDVVVKKEFSGLRDGGIVSIEQMIKRPIYERS